MSISYDCAVFVDSMLDHFHDPFNYIAPFAVLTRSPYKILKYIIELICVCMYILVMRFKNFRVFILGGNMESDVGEVQSEDELTDASTISD